jgi:predicted dehydrogenase
VNHAAAAPRPRLGFLGVGWLGRARLAALTREGTAVAAAVADPSAECRDACRPLAPDANYGATLDTLLEQPLDGLVIATPNAFHATQAMRALRAGLPVFCQKPLGRTGAETLAVLGAAKVADRLLAVDLCYRETRAARAIKELISQGDLGRVYALDLVFHSAFGPEKPWFYRRSQSGGGCLLDHGIHLVDLALWLTGDRCIRSARGTLLRAGRRLTAGTDDVEDFATAELTLESGAQVRVACSWRLPAGADAVISVHVWGTTGGAVMRNVAGSFFDFLTERLVGTRAQTLVAPPDPWGGRAVTAWAERLAHSRSFDPAVEDIAEVARAIDEVYGPCAS